MKALTKLWAEMSAPKQELASQKVKLSVVDQLEKNTEIMFDEARELEGYISDFDQQMDRAYGTYIMMKGLWESLTNDLASVESDIDKVEAAAKELGVEVPVVDEARRAIREAEAAYGDAEERIRKFNL